MGRTNRLEAVEQKIGYLLAEKEDLGPEIEKAEALIQKLPDMRERLWEIDTLIKAAEAFIKDDHPTWTGDHITPIRKMGSQEPDQTWAANAGSAFNPSRGGPAPDMSRGRGTAPSPCWP